nr:MAG TPA: hypothetical protein [Caudoviricetes sp.]
MIFNFNSPYKDCFLFYVIFVKRNNKLIYKE